MPELAAFAEEHKDWLQVFQMPSSSTELSATEGIWSLLMRHLAGLRRRRSGTPHPA
ncbi:hypothetical protein [Streptomyces sp. NPDC048825]|uniref:hypothetical protein n=1 Tax=Streptomyces sp. NPDC048825 TaxID=3365592 RepID=UPI003712B083